MATNINDLRRADAFIQYTDWQFDGAPKANLQAALDWLFLHVGPTRLGKVKSVDHHPFNQARFMGEGDDGPNDFLYLCEVMQSMDLSKRPVGKVAASGEAFVNFRTAAESASFQGKGSYYVHVGRLLGGKAMKLVVDNQRLGIPLDQNKQHLYLVSGPSMHYLEAKVADAVSWQQQSAWTLQAARKQNDTLEAALRNAGTPEEAERVKWKLKQSYFAGGGTQCYVADPMAHLRLLRL